MQWNIQVLSHLVDHGDDPQRAVSLPRFTVFPGSDADVVGNPPELRCEEGIAEATLAGLVERGHDVRRVPPQTGGPGGSALAISLDHDRGVLRAARRPPDGRGSPCVLSCPDAAGRRRRAATSPPTATDALVLTAGMTPRVDGVLQHVGRVGGEVSLDDAREAAGSRSPTRWPPRAPRSARWTASPGRCGWWCS